VSILRRRRPTLRYHELHSPLPKDACLSVAGFHADVTRPLSRSCRTVSSVGQQCLDETERGLPLSNVFKLERHLVYCAIRSRPWREQILRSSWTMAARALQAQVPQTDVRRPGSHHQVGRVHASANCDAVRRGPRTDLTATADMGVEFQQ